MTTQNAQITNVKLAPWVTAAVQANAPAMDYTVPAPIPDPEYQENRVKVNHATDPIRALEDIDRLKNYFLNRKGYKIASIRNYAYFVLSLNISRRASDVLNLKIGDILDLDGNFKEHLVIYEHKNKNVATIFLHPNARAALALYLNTLESYREGDWLFPKYNNPAEKATVEGMRKMLQRAAADLNIDMHMGTHSLRKTMPYHARLNGVSTPTISKYLGHRNEKVTHHYLGWEQEEEDAMVMANGL